MQVVLLDFGVIIIQKQDIITIELRTFITDFRTMSGTIRQGGAHGGR